MLRSKPPFYQSEIQCSDPSLKIWIKSQWYTTAELVILAYGIEQLLTKNLLISTNNLYLVSIVIFLTEITIKMTLTIKTGIN
jgi:hypothetical protein